MEVQVEEEEEGLFPFNPAQPPPPGPTPKLRAIRQLVFFVIFRDGGFYSFSNPQQEVQ